MIRKFLILMLTAVAVSVHAEDYRFTVFPKCDSIVVYDKNNNAVLKYAKDTLVYQDVSITKTKDGKAIVFADMSGEIGRTASKKYEKIIMADGSTYKRKSKGKNFSYTKKLSYKKDGNISATAYYSFEKKLYAAIRNNEIIVEMNTSDAKFVPFLFCSVLAHIQMTKDAEEQLLWLNTFTFLY
jgi:hypothetical protein